MIIEDYDYMIIEDRIYVICTHIYAHTLYYAYNLRAEGSLFP